MAQLVEYDLAKVGVAGSSPVSRSQEYGFRVIRDPLFVCVNEITMQVFGDVDFLTPQLIVT